MGSMCVAGCFVSCALQYFFGFWACCGFVLAWHCCGWCVLCMGVVAFSFNYSVWYADAWPSAVSPDVLACKASQLYCTLFYVCFIRVYPLSIMGSCTPYFCAFPPFDSRIMHSTHPRSVSAWIRMCDHGAAAQQQHCRLQQGWSLLHTAPAEGAATLLQLFVFIQV
jgi:hypothetical protein